MKPSRYLIAGQDAGRTGAPILLLNFLKWVRCNRPDLEFDILLIEGGPLLNEYRLVGDVTVLSEAKTLVDKIADQLSRIRDPRAMRRLPRASVLKRGYDVVLGNTIVSLPLLEHFAGRGAATVCWVHEMEHVARVFFEDEKLSRMMNAVDRIVLASHALEPMLATFNIQTPFSVAYEPHPSTPPISSEDRLKYRAELGIPGEAFVVLGCGQIGWRKGVDIFLEIANRIISTQDDLWFIWLGGEPRITDQYTLQIRKDAVAISSGRVVLAGEHADVRPYFASADLFALTSREDPFPLVVLEAADHSVPTICFEQAGGAPEFVGNDAGRVVSFGDIDGFADSILRLLRDRRELTKLGATAKAKFDGPFSIQTNAAKVLNVLEEEGFKRGGRGQTV